MKIYLFVAGDYFSFKKISQMNEFGEIIFCPTDYDKALNLLTSNED